MRSRTRLIVALALLLALSSVSGAFAGQTAIEPMQRQMSAVLPDSRATLEQQIDAELSRYELDVEFTRESGDNLGSISGELDLAWVNPADEPATEMLFRLYPNDARYGDGSLAVSDIEINGAEVDPAFELDDTLMRLPLDEPIPAGGQAEVRMSFAATIPNDTLSGFGMFNHDTRTDAYTLDHWFPLLAGYDPANGFDTAPISVNGDPVFTNVAFFEVTIERDSNLVLASTGVPVSEAETKHGRTQIFVSGPVRNFTMSISEHYQVSTGMAGETEVRSYYLPGHEVRGEETVRWSIDAINLFNELVGPYPYAQFSVIDAELGGGAAGIEFPQIVFMASSYYDDPLDQERFPHGQEYTLVHEVLHQWFYGLVGNNQHRYAFLDESLTNYLTTVYFERLYDEDTALQQSLLNLLAPYVIYLHGMTGGPREDEAVNTPTDEFSSSTAYGVIIYNKGPLAMQAIREALGDDAFFTAISTYFARMQLLIAQPEDMEAAFAEQSPPDLDFDALWRHWIEETNGAEDFPPELLEEILILLRGG
jgi:hypothetical protein